jgi:amino acid permease
MKRFMFMMMAVVAFVISSCNSEALLKSKHIVGLGIIMLIVVVILSWLIYEGLKNLFEWIMKNLL